MVPPGRVTRDDLVAFLRKAGLRVSHVQLRGWRDAGLLPLAKRSGMGRGQGWVSHYPWWAVPQAAALATALDERRNLDDAGWAIWVLGFPVTPFARTLLLRELRTQEGLYRQLLKPRGAEQAAAAMARDRRDGGPMLHKASGPHLADTLRFIADLHIGEASNPPPDGDELEDVQYDLARWIELVTKAKPSALTSSKELPGSAGIRDAVATFKHTQSVPVLRGIVKKLPVGMLRVACNEAQELTSHLAREAGWEDAPLITRPTFLRYLSRRMHDPAGSKDAIALIKALGWTRPPLSPFAAMLDALRNTPPRGVLA